MSEQVESIQAQEPEEPSMVSRIVDYLVGREDYREAVVLAEFVLPHGAAGRRTIWEAVQAMREEHGVEFVPGEEPGQFVRATHRQRVRRGLAFARTSRRKLARALAVLEATPVDVTLTADERRALDSAKAKVGDMVMLAEIRARHESKPKPPGI